TVDETLDQQEVFGTVEAVKTVSDLFMPISGEIVEFNESLEQEPEKVNADPYGDGWMIKIKISKAEELDGLLDDAGYKEVIGG
ncbi:MAG: glycine cleavage system protein H, partial [Bacteroidia bacterium]|nr:glycine cleavage system protein H [Bacteroidia bacterium]